MRVPPLGSLSLAWAALGAGVALGSDLVHGASETPCTSEQASQEPAVEPGVEPKRPPMGRAFLFRIDAQEGRRRGWADAAATDEEIFERVFASMRGRIRSSGRFVEAQAALEPDGIVSVTFVGRMSRSIEDMLANGLGGAGRLEWGLPATPSSGLDAERARLARWLAARKEAGEDPNPFAFAAHSAGASESSLRWAPELGASLDERWSADAWHPFEAASLRLLRRDEVERMAMRSQERNWLLLVVPREGARESFESACIEPPPDAEGETGAADEGSPPARAQPRARLLLDGCVAPPLTQTRVPGDGEFFAVAFGRRLAAAREFLLAFAGEPLQAPLAFTGFAKRPLANVVTHVPGDDD